MTTENYELFIMPGCPFCHRVLDYMGEHGIELPLRDITQDRDAESRLIEVGGKRQVTCLFIDGRAPLIGRLRLPSTAWELEG